MYRVAQVVYRLLIPLNLLAVAWTGYGKILFGFLGFDTIGWYAFGFATFGTLILLTALGITTWRAIRRHRDGHVLTTGQAASQTTVWVSTLVFGVTFPDTDPESNVPSVLAALAGKTTTDDPVTGHQRYHTSAIDTLGDWTALAALLIGTTAWVALWVSLSRRNRNPEHPPDKHRTYKSNK